MIKFLIGKIFGTRNERYIRSLRPQLKKINGLEPAMQALTDEQIPQKLAEYRDAVQSGAVLALEYLRDIHGTCLEIGYCNDFNLDIGKLENFYLSPNYWLESGLPGTPDEQQLRTYMLRNSVGIHMGQADFFYFSDIHIQGYYKGFYFCGIICRFEILRNIVLFLAFTFFVI